jgi:hypothetical protein
MCLDALQSESTHSFFRDKYLFSSKYVSHKRSKRFHIFFCVGVVYSGEYDVCDVTLSVYPHRTNIFSVLVLCTQVNMMFEYDKVVGSIPTVVRHIFQACPVTVYFS